MNALNAWMLTRRALATHRAAAVLLAAVIGVGAFLGTAGPRWANDRLDTTLREVLIDAGARAELSQRAGLVPEPGPLAAEIPQLSTTARPELERVLGAGRWAVTTGTSQLLAQNDGVTKDGPRPRHTTIRVPDDLAGRVRLVDGALPARIDAVPTTPTLRGLPVPTTEQLAIVDVVATPAVAEALRLEVGDVVAYEHKNHKSTAISAIEGGRMLVAARLTGLVEPLDPADPAWRDAGTAVEPDLGQPGAEPRITIGTLLADPEQLPDWIAATGIFVDADWHVALQVGQVRADRVDAVTADLRQLTTSTAWRSGLTDLLDRYTARRQAADGVVAFGVVSLGALCAILVVLAARLGAERRADEVALARTRGASDAALARLLALDAAVVAVPAALLGAGAGLALVPGRLGLLSLAVPVVLLVLTLVSVPVAAIAQARRAGPGGSGEGERADVAARRPTPRRLAVEAGVVVFAGITLWLAGTRDPAPAGGVDLVVSLAPVLAAAAAGLVVMRAMPYLVAAILPVLRRTSRLTPFVAITNAARAPGHAVLPVVAVLVAVGVAAFGGTVKATVEHAQNVSSWDQVGGDALVRSGSVRVAPEEIAAIPGAEATALGHLVVSQRPENLDTGRHGGVDVLAVDVPAWQRVVDAAPEPLAPVRALSAPTPSGAVPAVLQGSVDVIAVGDRLELTLRGATIVVQVVDQLTTVPGADSSATLVVPLDPFVRADASLDPANVIYVGGDVTADGVATTLGIDTDEVSTRSAALASISGDPVLETVLDAFTIIAAVAAALAATAALIGLAVGERVRSYGLSVLRTLGLTTGQTATLTAADVIPTSVLAALAGIGVGTGVGVVTAGALDLSALAGTVSRAAGIVADLPGAVRAAAIVLGVVLVAVAGAVIVNRRAALGSVLRAGG